MKNKFLVTGGCGFLGSNIASELINRKEEVVVLDNLHRFGSAQNLSWLESQGDFKFLHRDVRNRSDVEETIQEEKPDVVFHLAGQVAMTTSVERPNLDFDINVVGSFNLLESIRKYSPESIIIYSSTNKVYGDLEQYEYIEKEKRYICKEHPEGFAEDTPLNFTSPYGCSKGAADQYMLDYHKMFGLKTVVFRHSSMLGGRQFATYDQGWVGWFVQQAIEQSKDSEYPTFTVSGNGKQVRDLLFVEDVISCYLRTYEHIDKTVGKAFNIGGGYENSLSILELFDYLEEKLNISLRYKHIERRASDQKVFIANTTKINKTIEWQPKLDKVTGLNEMVEWIKSMEK